MYLLALLWTVLTAASHTYCSSEIVLRPNCFQETLVRLHTAPSLPIEGNMILLNSSRKHLRPYEVIQVSSTICIVGAA